MFPYNSVVDTLKTLKIQKQMELTLITRFFSFPTVVSKSLYSYITKIFYGLRPIRKSKVDTFKVYDAILNDFKDLPRSKIHFEKSHISPCFFRYRTLVGLLYAPWSMAHKVRQSPGASPRSTGRNYYYNNNDDYYCCNNYEHINVMSTFKILI